MIVYSETLKNVSVSITLVSPGLVNKFLGSKELQLHSKFSGLNEFCQLIYFQSCLVLSFIVLTTFSFSLGIGPGTSYSLRLDN